MRKSVTIMLVTLCSTAYAAIGTAGSTVDYCPKIADIQQTHSIYRANTNAGGEWLGIASSGSSGAIVQFDSAMIYPDQHGNAANATVGKCSYRLNSGMVDLRYQPGTTPEPRVSVTSPNVWERREGPFGLVFLECKQGDPQACKFTVNK
ncbi:DUF3757 domain-containing protein (plasmid) [Ralstonia syzygii subsp. celebesensis]|uniref:DUF3757 domain-containing protein n=3 Tax=Ralstonia solanacearum species complex TaxID=3116862 RepID=A0AAD0WIL5_RALSL|nr:MULTISPECIES: DUF3757 domain-containing protein [Ralstonia solanacearum species complex]CCA82908.1 conserved exported hypothetical protein [blood disease bacterium R229]AQW32065.1 hypothetical protein B0B51_19440 [blood disease bacterium A2-HR MARDI]AXV83991.1 DUF3757 domain-containing protein [Ralstonia solanacearum]AXW55119.1 DUF3757 domain-containing protein [Ralstonia solanacearum]QQV57514.1 DUF3757 domain-containing protein [Ralstonia syzygii subsp. celebesensis]